jgi:hypothetical protein
VSSLRRRWRGSPGRAAVAPPAILSRITAFGAAAAVALWCAACSPPQVASVPDPVLEFSAERIKAHTTFLADDLLEGRESGTRGHELAARYIASQFALLGVEPGGADGTYFQKVDLLEAAPTGPPARLIVLNSQGRQVLEHGRAVLIRGPIAGGQIDLRAPMVFAGYGMTDAAVGFDDYEKLDVRGKIVVVLSGSPTGFNSEIGAHLQSEQTRVAAEHGAVAIVAVQTNAAARAFPWEQYLKLREDTVTTWVRRSGDPVDPIDGLKASVVVDPKAAGFLFEGAPQTLTQILAEADLPNGRPKGFLLDATAHVTVATAIRRYSSPEVIGLIEGTDPALKDEFVVLMGHADHIGITPGEGRDRINNGALDNAAGVATLIEVAGALTAAPERPRRSTLVVANTGEEKGLLGAEYFAHNPTVPIERITAAIDLDMPMLLYDFTDVVAYGSTHSTLETAFQNAAAAMGVKLSPDPMPEQAVFVRSDHYAMVKAGVPAVMLATGMANGGEAAWTKYLGSTYHQPSDDLSQPIVWAAGAKFAALNYRVVRELADADSRARWLAGDYFGNLFAPKAPRAEAPPGR